MILAAATWALALAGQSDVGPLGGERLVAVEDRSTRALELVLLDAGVISPLTFGPYPARRAAHLVDRLAAGDVDVPIAFDHALEVVKGPVDLTDAERAALLFNVRSFALLSDGRGTLQLSPQLGLELYGRGTPVGEGPAWDREFKDRQPPAALDIQAAWHVIDGVTAWGRMTLDITQDPNLFRQAGRPAQQTNIMPLDGIDWSFPHRATVAVGGEGYSVSVGRDRLSLGEGRMGNMMLGDSADFHDHARLQLDTAFPVGSFTFTSLLIRLDPSLTTEELALPGMDVLVAQQKHLVLHRADVVFFDKLRLAVSEAWLAGGVPLDLRHLNPLLVFHNLFAWNDTPPYDSASIMVGLEASVVPVRGVKLWGQYAVNQIQFPLEELWYGEAATTIPNADGALGGVELTAPLRLFEPRDVPWTKLTGVAHLYAGVEAAGTSAWFGVREHPLITWTARRRVPSNLPGGQDLFDQPIGWRDGPDSQAWRVWLGALDVGFGHVEVAYEERVRGEQRFTTPYEVSAEAAALSTPTGTPERARVVIVQAEVLPLRFERFSGRLRVDYRRFFVDAFNHERGRTVVDDQLVLTANIGL